ncbi:MAG: glycoside hydrolase family 5 protein [Bacteroides sp.]|nr:glycoside hydrolase family 5 protein [Bacteroides sp.]
MKKDFFCLLLCIMACLFTACGGDDPIDTLIDKPETEEPETPVVPEEPDVPDEPVWDDQGWITATEAIEKMGLGWNLGNTLDACDFTKNFGAADWRAWETCWGQPVTSPELMQMIKDAGFGAMRIPVTWKGHLDANGKVDATWMNRVKEVVGYVLDAGMYCIVNVHHDTGADESAWLVASMNKYNENKALYEGLWKQIAETFKEYDERLMFESYNEMLDERRSWCFSTFAGGYDATEAADAYKAINSYAQSFVDVVRATGGNNVGRNLIVNTYGACNGAGTWNPHLIDPLVEMQLPEDVVENHLLFEVHTYPNIDNLNSAKQEVAGMITNLKKHLVEKGAPVIIGEWGNSSDNPSLENRLAFITDFVKQVKAAGMGMYYWMGLSDATARQLPAFSEPECALAMLKAYHGDAFSPELPTLNTVDFAYDVTYNQQWAEAKVCKENINLNDYKGIRVELAEAPKNGVLSIKCYGEGEGVSYNVAVTDAVTELEFDAAKLGGKATRVTLQCMTTPTVKTTIKRAVLIRHDGTEEVQTPSSFWGCEVILNQT